MFYLSPLILDEATLMFTRHGSSRPVWATIMTRVWRVSPDRPYQQTCDFKFNLYTLDFILKLNCPFKADNHRLTLQVTPEPNKPVWNTSVLLLKCSKHPANIYFYLTAKNSSYLEWTSAAAGTNATLCLRAAWWNIRNVKIFTSRAEGQRQVYLRLGREIERDTGGGRERLSNVFISVTLRFSNCREE